jgi:hypothetical protein
MEEVIFKGVPNFNGKNSCKPIVEIIKVKDNIKVKMRDLALEIQIIN